MLSLILSIVFWCTKNRTLGIVATVLSVLGLIVDFQLVGIFALLDLIVVIADVVVLDKCEKG